MDLHEVGCRGWTAMMWLGIGTGGRHLWVLEWTFGLRKMRGISWLAANRLASQDGLCSMLHGVSKYQITRCHIREERYSCRWCVWIARSSFGVESNMISKKRFQETCGKEVAVPHVWGTTQIFVYRGLRKIRKNLMTAGLRAEKWTQYLHTAVRHRVPMSQQPVDCHCAPS